MIDAKLDPNETALCKSQLEYGTDFVDVGVMSLQDAQCVVTVQKIVVCGQFLSQQRCFDIPLVSVGSVEVQPSGSSGNIHHTVKVVDKTTSIPGQRHISLQPLDGDLASANELASCILRALPKTGS